MKGTSPADSISTATRRQGQWVTCASRKISRREPRISGSRGARTGRRRRGPKIFARGFETLRVSLQLSWPSQHSCSAIDRGATDREAGAHHRDHGPGRLLSGRAPARRRGTRSTALIRRSSLLQHRADRPPLPGPARRRPAADPPLRRPQRRVVAQPDAAPDRIPDEIYNLGAQSHVKVSFDTPEYTGDVTGLGTVRLLEAIRELRIRPRIYQASLLARCSAAAPEVPQTERTPFHPRSPYAAAKVYAYWMTVNYREAYGLFAVNGILFNHESPRRGETFVIAQDHARGRAHRARARRRSSTSAISRRGATGATPSDYVEAMWLMLQQRDARRLRHRHRREPHGPRVLRARLRAGGSSSGAARASRRRAWKSPAASSSRSTRATSGRRRSSTCWATPRGPASASAGSRRSTSARLVDLMTDADLELAARRARRAGHGRPSASRMRELLERVGASSSPAAAGSWAATRRAARGASSRRPIVVAALRASTTCATADGRGALPPATRGPTRDPPRPRSSAASAPTARTPAGSSTTTPSMGIQLIEEARRAGRREVRRASARSAPTRSYTPVPFREDDLWNGYPEETNAPYGLAKKMLLVQLQAYRQQYGFNGIFLLPVNLYGPGDNFDPESSHVIPALIRKFVEARGAGPTEVVALGRRLADARVPLRATTRPRASCWPPSATTGPSPSTSARASRSRSATSRRRSRGLTGFHGAIRWDSSRPNGQPRRRLDTSRARALFGFEARVGFDEGLRETIAWWDAARTKRAERMIADGGRERAATRWTLAAFAALLGPLLRSLPALHQPQRALPLRVRRRRRGPLHLRDRLGGPGPGRPRGQVRVGRTDVLQQGARAWPSPRCPSTSSCAPSSRRRRGRRPDLLDLRVLTVSLVCALALARLGAAAGGADGSSRRGARWFSPPSPSAPPFSSLRGRSSRTPGRPRCCSWPLTCSARASGAPLRGERRRFRCSPDFSRAGRRSRSTRWLQWRC